MADGKFKVLVIDDEEATRTIFTQALETGGFAVIAAATGNEGINKAKSENPHIVLVDQILPDINGGEILHVLKQDPATKNIPVVIVSNFAQDTMIQDAINNGAADYLMKYQISAEDLVAKVHQIIKEYTS